MDSLFQLSTNDGLVARLLQITDTHLFDNTEKTLLSVNTFQSYQAVLAEIRRRNEVYDLIAATGDLVQDQTVAAYRSFAEGIAQLVSPCVWLPGNHDFQPAMVNVLSAAGILPFKQVLLGDYWQLILMDSQVAGSPHGSLSEYQLKWLDKCLSQYPKRFALILLHHNPVVSGCLWLDQHRLRNSHELDEVLTRHLQVKAILCGHIHQELDVDWHGRRVLATPSTCMQFKKHSTGFMLDSLAPGWRCLELFPDGNIKTEVYRLNHHLFMPDMDAEGY